MRLLIAVIGALMLSSLVFGATETRQVGPYTVSFDVNTNMNTKLQHQIRRCILSPRSIPL
jgi:hypothetical protein